MASGFKIGTTSGGVTSLDALTTPLPDPQQDNPKYRVLKKLGNGKMKGFGAERVIWAFPILEVEQITQLLTFDVDANIYVRSRKRDDTWGLFEVVMNVIDPRYDGEHMPGFQGHRRGLTVEFTVISEVV